MTIFEEIKYSLVGQKPVTYKYFADGRRVLVEQDENVRWFVRLLVRLVVLLLFLSLLRMFGFIPSDWTTVSNVVGVTREANGTTNSGSGATGSNSGDSGTTGGANGGNGTDGGLVFGSGDASTDGQPGSAIVGDGTTTGGNGVIGADGAPGPAGPAGPKGDKGDPGAPGADGINGIDGVGGGGTTIITNPSTGQGSVGIQGCDDAVDISLRSYWATTTFKLDRIVISNVSDACQGMSLTAVLLDSSSGELLNLTIPSISLNNNTITLTRNVYSAIGNVRSQNIHDIAFEIAG